MSEKRKGFLDLCNLLKRYKRKVSYSEIFETVCKEGWYSDFARLGHNTVIRQINRHNNQFPNAAEIPYNSES